MWLFSLISCRKILFSNTPLFLFSSDTLSYFLDEICAAIKIGFNETRCVLEPAGALAIAGMVKYIKENKMEGCTYVAISSGANMDFDRYGTEMAIRLVWE